MIRTKFLEIPAIGGASLFLLFALAAESLAQQPGPGSPPEVAVREASIETLHLYKTYSARLKEHDSVTISPEVSGVLVERLFTEGAPVERGQDLFRIQPDVYRASMASAEAEVKKAEAALGTASSRFARYQRLVRTSAVSEQDYEAAEAEMKAAEATLMAAQARLDLSRLDYEKTTIKSPVSGVIGESLVSVGNIVNGQVAMTEIKAIDPIEVEISVPSSDFFEMSTGGLSLPQNHSVSLLLPEEVHYEQTGTVSFIDNKIDADTDSIKLKATFANPDHVLVPGLFTRARIHYEEIEAILVPHQAVSRDPQGNALLWVVDEDSSVNPKKITVSGTHDNRWIVSDGLSEGEVYVVEGFQRISPGIAVNAALED